MLSLPLFGCTICKQSQTNLVHNWCFLMQNFKCYSVFFDAIIFSFRLCFHSVLSHKQSVEPDRYKENIGKDAEEIKMARKMYKNFAMSLKMSCRFGFLICLWLKPKIWGNAHLTNNINFNNTSLFSFALCAEGNNTLTNIKTWKIFKSYIRFEWPTEKNSEKPVNFTPPHNQIYAW